MDSKTSEAGSPDTTTTEPSVWEALDKLDEILEDTNTKFDPSVCEHCGRLFRPGDSITLRADGSIKQCVHWPDLTPRSETECL